MRAFSYTTSPLTLPPSQGVKLGDKAERAEKILLLRINVTSQQANGKSRSEALTPRQLLLPRELPFAPRPHFNSALLVKKQNPSQATRQGPALLLNLLCFNKKPVHEKAGVFGADRILPLLEGRD